MVKKLKSLSIGCFDSSDGGLLLIIKEKTIMLPRGELTDEESSQEHEKWVRQFVPKVMEEETGLVDLIKDEKKVPIKESVQDVPAMYNAYEGEDMHSAIILGEFDYSSLKNPYASPLSYNDFVLFVRDRHFKVAPEQRVLITRIYSSRDNPDRIASRKAGKALKKLLEQRNK